MMTRVSAGVGRKVSGSSSGTRIEERVSGAHGEGDSCVVHEHGGPWEGSDGDEAGFVSELVELSEQRMRERGVEALQLEHQRPARHPRRYTLCHPVYCSLSASPCVA